MIRALYKQTNDNTSGEGEYWCMVMNRSCVWRAVSVT